MKSEVCRAVVETNVNGLVRYDWMASRTDAQALLDIILRTFRPQGHIELLRSYVECVVSYIT